ncbi:DUF6223 family protein [Dactylosporangium sp. CA-233914]|uniref:DUF6223 family protein n=1 Tax=Dactylosporangium sp. CA-233914 TaxID=3239934 RepID=UPI003D950795
MSVPILYAASAVGAYTLTADRVVASVAALVALAGAVVGGLALAGRGGPRGPVAALVTGAAGLVAGGLVVATADGGPGTGNGIVGGYVAIVLGLGAVILGGLARARSRRAA